MDEFVAELAVLVGANISGLVTGLQQANREVETFAGGFISRLRGIGEGMTRLGGQVALLTAPLALMLTGSVTAGLEFDKTMTNVAAVVGETREAMSGVTDQVLALGGDALAGPQAAAAAYYDIVGGVTDATSRMAIFEEAIATAEAGSADLGATTSALISVMNGYGYGAEQAGFASDVMTRTVGVGVGTMGELAEALPNVAGLASSVGISFDDLSASLAFVTTKGFSFSEASTQMSAMITALIKPNESMKTALQEMGFATGEAAIESLGLVGAYQAMAGTQTATTEGMAKLLGSVEALNGVISLTDEAATNFLASFSVGLDGATDSAREIQRSSPAAELELAGARAQALAIAFSRVLLPSIGAVAGVFNDFTLQLFDFMTKNPELVRAIAEVAVVMVAAGPAIAGVGIAIGLLLNPVALAVGAIGALAVVVRMNQDAIQQWYKGLAFVSDVSGFEGAMRYIASGLGNIRIGDSSVRDIVADIQGKIETAINGISLQVSGFTNEIETSIQNGVNQLIFDASMMASNLKNSIQNSVSELGIDFSGINDGLQSGVQDAIAGLNAIDTSGVQTWATENFDRIVGVVISVAGIVFGGPLSMAIGAARLISSAIENDFMGIGTFLKEARILEGVTAAFNDLKAGIEDAISSIFGGGGSGASAPSGVDGGLLGQRVAAEVGGGGSGLLTRIGEDLQRGLEFIQGIFTRIGPGIQDGLNSFFSGVQGFFEALRDTDTEGLYEVVQVVGAVLGGIVTMVVTAAGQGIETTLKALGNALPQVGQALSSIIEAFGKVGQGDIGGALQSVVDALGSLVSATAGISLDIIDGIFGFFEKMTGLELPGIRDILDGIGRGFGLFFNNLQRGVQLLVADLQIFAINAKIALDALTGGQNQQALAGEMITVVTGARNLRVADSFTTMLQQQVAGGEPIDLSIPVGQVDFGGGFSRVYGAMAEMLDPTRPEFQILVAGMGVQGKIVVEDALKEAFTIGDQQTITLLEPLAVALGIDITQVETDAAAQIATANPVVGITAALQVSPLISFVTNVVSAIQNAIGALNIPLDVIFSLFGYGGGGNDGADVEPPALSVGTPYVRREGLAYIHEGEAVLTAAENTAYRSLRMRPPVIAAAGDGGGSGRNITVNLTTYGSTPSELVDMLEREFKARDL